MRATLDRVAFADALAWVSDAASRRVDFPALAGIRMQFRPGSVVLAATDWDRWHMATIDSDASDDAVLLAPALLLRQLASAMSGATVDLATDDALSITSRGARYRCPLIPPVDYPDLPAWPEASGSVAADVLRDRVGKVAHAAGSMPNAKFDGLGLTAADGSLVMDGTDRFQMAWSGCDWSGDDFHARVPPKELVAAVKGLSGDVHIGVTESYLYLADSSRRAAVRTQQATAPIPMQSSFYSSESPTLVTVSTDEIQQAIKRLAALDSKSTTLRLTFDVADDSMRITATDDDREAEEVVPCEVSGPPERWNLGLKYVQAILAVSGPTVVIGRDPKRMPVVFDHPEDPLTHHSLATVRDT